MVQRATVQDILKEILKYEDNHFMLSNKELLFLDNISEDASHYGYSFTEKQYGWLQSILKKLSNG